MVKDCLTEKAVKDFLCKGNEIIFRKYSDKIDKDKKLKFEETLYTSTVFDHCSFEDFKDNYLKLMDEIKSFSEKLRGVENLVKIKTIRIYDNQDSMLGNSFYLIVKFEIYER